MPIIKSTSTTMASTLAAVIPYFAMSRTVSTPIPAMNTSATMRMGMRNRSVHRQPWRRRLAFASRQPADQVEHDEPDRAHRVFDVVAEDPQKEHVAGDVEDRAVHEHGGEHGLPGREGVLGGDPVSCQLEAVAEDLGTARTRQRHSR